MSRVNSADGNQDIDMRKRIDSNNPKDDSPALFSDDGNVRNQGFNGEPESVINIRGFYEVNRKKEPKKHSRLDRCCQTRWWIWFPFLIVLGVPSYVIICMPQVMRLLGIGTFPSVIIISIFAYIAFLFVFNFFMAMFTDPGRVPADLALECSILGTPGAYTMPIPEGYKDKEKLNAVVGFAPNWCELCQAWKPPRTHHCSVCKKCVLRMDHHCPFLFNCVGVKNHGYFLLFWFFSIIGMVYATIFTVCAFSAGKGGYMNRSLTKNHPLQLVEFLIIPLADRAGPMIGVLLLITIVMTLLVIFAGSEFFWHTGSDETMFEAEYGTESIFVKLGADHYCSVGTDFFEKSFEPSTQGLLGKHGWRRFFLPLPVIMDYKPFFNPMPSIEGCEDLVEELVKYEEKQTDPNGAVKTDSDIKIDDLNAAALDI